MDKKFIIEAVDKLHGFRTRLKECHYGADCMDIHLKTDEFIGELDEFEDALVENACALYGRIFPGELEPVLPESMDFQGVLEDLRGLAISIKREAGDELMMSGIVAIVDDFIKAVNKYLYLLLIIEGKEEE